MTQTTVAMTSQWLDTKLPIQGTFTAQGTDTFNANGGTYNTTVVWPWQYGNWPSYYYTYSGPARPIKLTLSEVERLRAAAKRDAKLKAILAKFTDQIEITVDFE